MKPAELRLNLGPRPDDAKPRPGLSFVGDVQRPSSFRGRADLRAPPRGAGTACRRNRSAPRRHSDAADRRFTSTWLVAASSEAGGRAAA